MDSCFTLHDNHNEAEYISNFSSSYREAKYEDLATNNSAWKEARHHFLIQQ
jgi:hypothetical protein